MTGTFENKGR